MRGSSLEVSGKTELEFFRYNLTSSDTVTVTWSLKLPQPLCWLCEANGQRKGVAKTMVGNTGRALTEPTLSLDFLVPE